MRDFHAFRSGFSLIVLDPVSPYFSLYEPSLWNGTTQRSYIK